MSSGMQIISTEELRERVKKLSKAELTAYVLGLLPQHTQWHCPHCNHEHKCSTKGLITREQALELLGERENK
jgi:transposase-like protein